MDNRELYHWGIKGMKWGVRRFQNKDGTLTPEGKKRYSEEEGKQLELVGKMKQFFKADQMTKIRLQNEIQGELSKANADNLRKARDEFKKYLDEEEAFFGNEKLYKKYLKKIGEPEDIATIDNLDEAFEVYMKEKGTYDAFVNGRYDTQSIYNKECEKVARDVLGKYSDTVVNKAYGHTTAKDLAVTWLKDAFWNELYQSALFNATPDELYHWGIKGMKWGRRRYQNKDGSLTPEGRKRYGDDDPNESVDQKRERLLKSTNAQELYKNRNLLTTNEINDRLNRINTEQRLADLAAKDVKAGKSKLDKFLEIGGKVEQVYNFCQKPMMKALMKQLGLSKVDEAAKKLKLADIDKFLADPDKYADKASDYAKYLGDISKANTLSKGLRNDGIIKAKKVAEQLKKEVEKETSKEEDTKPASQNGDTNSTPKNNTQTGNWKTSPYFKPNPKSEQEKVNEARENPIKNPDDTPISKGILYDRYGSEILNQFTDTKAVDVPKATVDSGKKYTDDYLKKLRNAYGAAHADSSEGELYHQLIKRMSQVTPNGTIKHSHA